MNSLLVSKEFIFTNTSTNMQYVYIHGFGTTGAGSTKFKKIKAFADNTSNTAIALEWNEHQTAIISCLTEQLNNQVNWQQPICFIGSSTGGNFTYQLLDAFKDKEMLMYFVLINPLVNVAQRKIENLSFPLELAHQLKNPSDNIANGLILLGKKDEVLDYAYTYNIFKDKNTVIVNDDWNHTLSNLDTEEFIRFIQQAHS